MSTASGGGRMSAEARAELERAILADEIENDAEYAEGFAGRHGLNPVSVRSAISRLRRELGKQKRRTHAGTTTSAGNKSGGSRTSALGVLSGDAGDRRIARVGAAALVRYEDDDSFRAAVDKERAEIVRIRDSVLRFRSTTAELLPEEREDLELLLRRGLTPEQE